MWKLQVHFRCIPLLLSNTFFEIGSLTEPVVHQSTSLYLLQLELQACAATPAFHMCARAFVFAQQTLRIEPSLQPKEKCLHTAWPRLLISPWSGTLRSSLQIPVQSSCLNRHSTSSHVSSSTQCYDYFSWCVNI